MDFLHFHQFLSKINKFFKITCCQKLKVYFKLGNVSYFICLTSPIALVTFSATLSCVLTAEKNALLFLLICWANPTSTKSKWWLNLSCTLFVGNWFPSTPNTSLNDSLFAKEKFWEKKIFGMGLASDLIICEASFKLNWGKSCCNELCVGRREDCTTELEDFRSWSFR